jgi:hypothetical protein
LVSSVLGHLFPLKRGRDARRFGVDPSINWGDIYLYNCSVYQRRVEAEDLRGAFPRTCIYALGGFLSSSVTLNFLSARGVPSGLSPIWNPAG